ncbi:hypothetical protein [Micromonospora globispora]|uniref:hypothetical protein n=1 Tax=Micromonospora globispora TaxID=1450148 RepID=UPI001402B187|nr:hypothetical protein [Micromonospora globispora]
MASEQVAVPAQDGVGGDDQVELAQPGAGQLVQEGGEVRPVGRGEAGLVDLALQDGELVAQRQDLDVFVRVARGQQAYEGEDARERQVGQSQQHDRPSWRTPSGHQAPANWQVTSYGWDFGPHIITAQRIAGPTAVRGSLRVVPSR